MIHISQQAQEYLQKLLAKQSDNKLQLRVNIYELGKSTARAVIEFFKPDVNFLDDIAMGYPGFTLFVNHREFRYLEDASINLENEGLNQKLIIHAPGILPKATEIPEHASLAEQVQYVLDTEINPALAAHGGNVALVEITAESAVILEFSGGCQGCGMANVTLKQGIETNLLEKFPQITAVRDVTDHASGENPYF